MHVSRSRPRPTAVACVWLVLLLACAPADEPAPPAPDPPTGAPADPEAEEEVDPGLDPGVELTVPADELEPDPVGLAAPGPQQSEDYPRADEERARLADARLIALPGIDRFVLEFDGALPSWAIREVTPPILEHPGRTEVLLPGEGFLEVRTVPATTLDLDAADPTAAYEGPSHLDGDAPGVLEAVLTGDDGGLLVWTLGLDGQAAVAVATLEDPPRLVVDVLAPPG